MSMFKIRNGKGEMQDIVVLHGKNVGYDDGYSAGRKDGLQEGYSVGVEEGYNNGYETAKEEVMSDPQNIIDVKASGILSGDITVLATNIANYAFCRNAITGISAPNAETIGLYSFSDCSSLISGDFPKVTSLNNYSFNSCGKLTNLNIPLVTSLPTAALYSSRVLKRLDLHKVTSIAVSSLSVTSALKQLIIRTDSVCSLASTQAFTNSAIANGTGLIFVPSSLVDSYKSATNWSTYSTLFRSVEDITVDGTIMGELDEDKITAAMATL